MLGVPKRGLLQRFDRWGAVCRSPSSDRVHALDHFFPVTARIYPTAERKRDEARLEARQPAIPSMPQTLNTNVFVNTSPEQSNRRAIDPPLAKSHPEDRGRAIVLNRRPESDRDWNFWRQDFRGYRLWVPVAPATGYALHSTLSFLGVAAGWII